MINSLNGKLATLIKVKKLYVKYVIQKLLGFFGSSRIYLLLWEVWSRFCEQNGSQLLAKEDQNDDNEQIVATTN